MRTANLEALQQCTLFAQLSSTDIENIAKNYASFSVCDKHTIIFSETNYKRALVIILKGSASVTKKSDNAKILMSILKKGDIFGMATLFHEEDLFLTEITAQEKVSMLTIEKNDLAKIFALYPVIAENYITILSERIHFLNKKISTYTKTETISKVASMILQYADSENKTAILPYSVTKVAEALNAGRASVYRAFDTLEQNGAIKKEGKIIHILNIEQLKLI